MREVNFLYYLEHVLATGVKALGIEFPIILHLDNHSALFTTKVSQKCEQLGIILVCMYPNTSQITQPLDASVFKPLKQEWVKYVTDKTSVLLSITAKNFARHFMTFLKSINIKPWIVSGFKACGIFPWSFSSIDYGKIRTECQRKKLNQDHVVWADSVLARWRNSKALLNLDAPEALAVDNEDSWTVVHLDEIPVYMDPISLEHESKCDFTLNESSMDSDYVTSHEIHSETVDSDQLSEVAHLKKPPCDLQQKVFFTQQEVVKFFQTSKLYSSPRKEIKNLPPTSTNADDVPLDLSSSTKQPPEPEITDEEGTFGQIKSIFGPTMYEKFANPDFQPENEDEEILQKLAVLCKQVKENKEQSQSLPQKREIVTDESFRKFLGEEENLQFKKDQMEKAMKKPKLSLKKNKKR